MRRLTRRRTVILSIPIFLALLTVGARGQIGTAQPAGASTTGRRPDSRAAVTRHLDMTYTMPVYRTREEWLSRKEFLRQQILFSAGLLPTPARCDLRAQVFGKLERRGYSVEKVYFESLPGFFATGNLYRPTGRTGPLPAVLCPHGHWAYGRLQNSESCSVPARCITLARQGFLVFSLDMVGYNDSRQVNHRLTGDRAALWGVGSLGLHLWNCIRSLDFLESLPEVDRSRIGCTGASGGGTQTFLLTAVDDRVAVSAPVNMVSAHMQGGDVCENAPLLRIDTNNMEFAAMAAPRPMILVSATGDWTRNTLEVEYPAIQRVYRLMGVEDRLTAVRVDAGHNYNQESRSHVYRWFSRWLIPSAAGVEIKETDVNPDAPSEILVFYGRDLPPNARSEGQIVEDLIGAARKELDSSKATDAASLQRFRDRFGPGLKFSLMAEAPRPAEVEAFSVVPSQQPSHRIVRMSLRRTGKADEVPTTLWLPGGQSPIRQAVVLVHPDGSEVFENEGGPGSLVAGLLRGGSSVLIPETFNTGRARFERMEKRNYFTTYNRTDDANRVQDILTVLSFARSQAGTLPIKVAGLARAGLWCLLARGLTREAADWLVDLDRFDTTSDEDFLAKLNIPGIRRAGDFRTAIALNPSGMLRMVRAGNGFDKTWIRAVFAAAGSADRVGVETATPSDDEVLRWLLGQSTSQ